MASTGGSDRSRIGTSIPTSRRSAPSSTRATASHSAPPASAALAMGTAPCPYPSALTTAQSAEEPTMPLRISALRRAASTSISAHTGRRRSAIEAPRSLIGITEVREDRGHQDGKVTSHQPLPRSPICRPTVNVGGQGGRLEGCHPTSQHGGDDARQHVTGAGGG